VLFGRGVVEEGQDRPAAIGHERLTDSGKEAAVENPGVLGARVLVDISRAEGKQIATLFALEVDAAKPRARRKPDTTALSRRDNDPLRGYEAWAPAAAALVARSTTLPGATCSAALPAANPSADFTFGVTARVMATPTM
jgi:hypothetical protein